MRAWRLRRLHHATAPRQVASLTTERRATCTGRRWRASCFGFVMQSTTTSILLAQNPHLRGEVLVRREATKVSRLIIPRGMKLPEHPAAADTFAIGVRGKAIFYVEREVRRIAPGVVLDIRGGESYSIDAEDTELEVIFVQGH